MSYHFRHLRHSSLLQLVASIFNNRKHSSLGKQTKYTPFQAHFDSEASAKIVRDQLNQHDKKQHKLRNIFSIRPELVFHVGEKVLLRKQKTTFQKAPSSFIPQFHQDVATIVKVDKTMLPYSYIISSDPTQSKKYYYTDLKRVTPYHKQLQRMESEKDINDSDKIIVQDFVHSTPTSLRSGKKLHNKSTLFYTIKRANQIEKVTKETLQLYQKIFGRNILVFSKIFHEPANKHLMF